MSDPLSSDLTNAEEAAILARLEGASPEVLGEVDAAIEAALDESEPRDVILAAARALARVGIRPATP